MSSQPEIKINKEVFKLQDQRVERVKLGRMSAEAFAALITPEDPFMLIDNVIYALTETEYYATRALYPVNVLSETAFRYVIDLEDKSFMHEMDRNALERIKTDLPTCPACRYKRYKDEVAKLIHKYNINVPAGHTEKQENMEIHPYPKVTGEITPLVSLLLPHIYRVTLPVRKGCIDCVEKHISQAYILGNEVICGYPEHMPILIGHLGEALDEMPVDSGYLRSTVEFCLAYTRKHKKPFVPIGLIIPLIEWARHNLAQAMEDQRDDISQAVNDNMNLDFTQEMKNELCILPKGMLDRLKGLLESADGFAASGNTSDMRVSWEGSMACATDTCAKMCPVFANMLRNRRLIFIGDITLANSAGYSNKDICSYIDQCLHRTN